MGCLILLAFTIATECKTKNPAARPRVIPFISLKVHRSAENILHLRLWGVNIQLRNKF